MDLKAHSPWSSEVVEQQSGPDLDILITRIMALQDTQGEPLHQKFTPEQIHSLLSKNVMVLDSLFRTDLRKQIDLLDFVHIMLKFIQHEPNETIQVLIALIDFFQGVSEVGNVGAVVRFSELTNQICEFNNGEEQYLGEQRIPTKKLPEAKKFDVITSQRLVRDIDTNPPVLIGNADQVLCRLNREKVTIDCIHHNHKMILKGSQAKEINRIITLDSQADQLLVQNPDLEVEQKITAKNIQLQGLFILDFMWAPRQQRIGALFRDGQLVFWDAHDKFEYEKCFFGGEKTEGEQQRIWHMEQVDRWITSDTLNRLQVWNLEYEDVESKVQHVLLAKGILNLVEIQHLKMTAIAALDNIILLYDFINLHALFHIEVNHSHMHSLISFRTYQVLVTAGQDNLVNVQSLDANFNDQSCVGELQGHTSLVTAIQCVEGTPMVVSSDDHFIVKVWDLRNMSCIQTLDVDLRSSIRMILDLYDHQKISFLSSRVTCMEFEQDVNRAATREDVHPIRINQDPSLTQIIVATNRDVRFLDARNGRIRRIVAGVLQSEDDEITSFRLINQNKKFIVGNQKGTVRMFSTKTGELLEEKFGHMREVSNIKIDYMNRLIVTSGYDSALLVQRQGPGNNELLREIKNAHASHEILLMDVSFYHNLIVTATSDRSIMIWNQEHGKLITVLNLAEDAEPSAITFINGYSLIAVADNRGQIQFIHFIMREDQIDLNLIGNIDLIKTILLRREERQGTKSNQKIATQSRAMLLHEFHEERRKTGRPSLLDKVNSVRTLNERESMKSGNLEINDYQTLGSNMDLASYNAIESRTSLALVQQKHPKIKVQDAKQIQVQEGQLSKNNTPSSSTIASTTKILIENQLSPRKEQQSTFKHRSVSRQKERSEHSQSEESDASDTNRSEVSENQRANQQRPVQKIKDSINESSNNPQTNKNKPQPAKKTPKPSIAINIVEGSNTQTLTENKDLSSRLIKSKTSHPSGEIINETNQFTFATQPESPNKVRKSTFNNRKGTQLYVSSRQSPKKQQFPLHMQLNGNLHSTAPTFESSQNMNTQIRDSQNFQRTESRHNSKPTDPTKIVRNETRHNTKTTDRSKDGELQRSTSLTKAQNQAHKKSSKSNQLTSEIQNLQPIYSQNSDKEELDSSKYIDQSDVVEGDDGVSFVDDPDQEINTQMDIIKDKNNRRRQKEFKLAQVIATRFLPDVAVSKSESNPSSASLIIGLSNGEIRRQDISNLFKRPEVVFVEHVNTRANYNAFRQSKEDQAAGTTSKVPVFKLLKKVIVRDILTSTIDSLHAHPRKKDEKAIVSKLRYSVAKLATVRGFKELTNHDANEATMDPLFPFSDKMLTQITAHKENLTGMEFMEISHKQLVTCSKDGQVKLWSYPDFQLTASVNIDHPLPVKWDVQIDQGKAQKVKVLFAMRTAKCLNKKQGQMFSISEENRLSFDKFFKVLMDGNFKDSVREENGVRARASVDHSEVNREKNNKDRLAVNRSERPDLYQSRAEGVKVNLTQKLDSASSHAQVNLQSNTIINLHSNTPTNPQLSLPTNTQPSKYQSRSNNSSPATKRRSHTNEGSRTKRSNLPRDMQKNGFQMDHIVTHNLNIPLRTNQKPQQNTDPTESTFFMTGLNTQEPAPSKTSNLPLSSKLASNVPSTRTSINEPLKGSSPTIPSQRNLSTAPQKLTISTSNFQKPNNIHIMRDEYSPRDLLFDKVKHIQFSELLGPSLRQLAETKKLHDAQSAWRKAQQTNNQDVTDETSNSKRLETKSALRNKSRL